MDARPKENVPPGRAAPLRPDQWRFLESLGLGSGCGRWVSLCQAERGGPARAASPGAARVQSNVAGPGLQDPTSSSARPGSRQQNNLQPRARRPPGRTRACAVQQSNLSRSGPGPPLRLGPGESLGPRARYQDSPLQRRPLAHLAPSLQRLPAIDVPCPDGRPLVGLGSLEEPTQPGPSSWGDLGSWPLGSGAESLTLEDLAVPAWSRARSPSQAAIHQLLASVQRLEHQVARLGRRASQKPPGPARQDPRSSRSQALSARPQLSQSLPASRGARGPPRGLRASAGLPEVPGVQEECPASGANSEPALAETTVGVLPGGPLDPEQGLLPAHPPSQGQECSPGPMDGGEPEGRPSLPGGAGSREASLCASASATPARGVPPGQEAGEGSPEEQASREEEKTASCPPDAAPVRGALQNEAQNTVTLEPETASRPLLSRCFRAWWRSAQRQRAVAETEALNRQHLLPKGLRGLRGAPWLCEAWLEAVRGQHTQALLTRSFREWKDLAAQRKQGQPHLQAGPGPPASGGGPDQGPLGRKAAVDPVQENSPGSLREEEGAWPTPGGRPDDGGVRGQVLQALERLAVFILWCHQKGGAGKKKGCLGEAAQVPQRTQRPGRPPQAWRAPAADVAWVAHLGTWGQRAWLRSIEGQGRTSARRAQDALERPQGWQPRAIDGWEEQAASSRHGCFAAWQQFKQRGARFRDHLADRRLGTLRTCLRQWVRMKQLRASDGAKVTQLYLCLQKAGAAALLGAAPGTATAHSPRPVAQGRAQGSLQDACRRLALHRALLLWRTRLSQRQQADRFLQGMRQRTLRRVLTQWHRRMWPLCSPPGSARITSAPQPLGSVQKSPRGPLERAPRDPCLLETLRASFLQAAGQRWRGQCLLLWRARAQQSQGAARWSQHTLQRRVLLSWGHWAAAQGDRRELAARWAQGRSYRAALGLWRQRLAQWREAEQWAQERSRALARDALRHWHTCWQRQQSLRAKYQRWVQIRVQGLRKAAFWGWQRAAARRTHRAAGRERLLLQRILEAWVQAAAQGRVQRAAVAQLQQARCRRLLRTRWARWRAALPRVRLEAPARAEEAQEAAGAQEAEETPGGCTVYPQPEAGLGHCLLAATGGRLLLLMDAPAAGRQTGSGWTQATGLVPPASAWLHSCGGQRKWRETFWPRGNGERDSRLHPAPSQLPLRQDFQLWLPWPMHYSWAQGERLWTEPGGDCSCETRALQGEGEAQQRRLGRKCLQRWRLEALLGRLQGARRARLLTATWQYWVDAQGAEQLARTLLRQRLLGWAWGTWRRRILQLRVAQRVQQQEGCVLSQAFEKWHQHLAARGPQRVAASSPKPLSKLGARGPGSSGKTRALAVVGLGRAWGPAAAVDLLFPKRRKQSCTLPSPGKELHPTHPASEALTRPGGRGTVRL